MSCCGSLFVNLGGAPIADGFLKTDAALTTTMQVVKDNAGNSSLFQLATNKAQFFLSSAASVKFCDGGNFLDFSDSAAGYIRYGLNAAIGIKFGGGNSTVLFGAGAANPILLANSANVDIGIGTITNNGVLTVKGGGGNIVSLRNSSNVEKIAFLNNGGASFDDDVTTRAAAQFRLLGHLKIFSPSDGIAILTNNGGTSFDRLQLGGTTTDFPAIVATNTTPTLSAKDATGTNLIPFSAEDFKSANLSAGTLNTARTMQFGDKGTVTTGNDLGLDAQIAVEHNGNVYYIPCSTVLLT